MEVIPAVIVFVLPLIVTDAVPMVTIPVTIAFPTTWRAEDGLVVAIPTDPLK